MPQSGGLRLVPGEAWFSATSCREATCLFPKTDDVTHLPQFDPVHHLPRAGQATQSPVQANNVYRVQLCASLWLLPVWHRVGEHLQKACFLRGEVLTLPSWGLAAKPSLGPAGRSCRTVPKKTMVFLFPLALQILRFFFSVR